jgi:hypothetical protein
MFYFVVKLNWLRTKLGGISSPKPPLSCVYVAIANPFGLFSDMVLLKKMFKKLSAENVLSGVKEVTDNVANNCKSILMFG